MRTRRTTRPSSGLAAQLLDPSVTIVVYTTGTLANTQDQNDAVEIGNRISTIMAPDDPLALSG